MSPMIQLHKQDLIWLYGRSSGYQITSMSLMWSITDPLIPNRFRIGTKSGWIHTYRSDSHCQIRVNWVNKILIRINAVQSTVHQRDPITFCGSLGTLQMCWASNCFYRRSRSRSAIFWCCLAGFCSLLPLPTGKDQLIDAAIEGINVEVIEQEEDESDLNGPKGLDTYMGKKFMFFFGNGPRIPTFQVLK